jgi:hypothetical protein
MDAVPLNQDANRLHALELTKKLLAVDINDRKISVRAQAPGDSVRSIDLLLERNPTFTNPNLELVARRKPGPNRLKAIKKNAGSIPAGA